MGVLIINQEANGKILYNLGVLERNKVKEGEILENLVKQWIGLLKKILNCI